jgi:hypothetical protein
MPAIAVVGDRNPEYETHRGIDRVLGSLPPGLTGRWCATESLDPAEATSAEGVWIAPGTPYRNREAVLEVIRHARADEQPILATCDGFQHMLLEYARSVAGIERAEHEEDHPAAGALLISRLSCSLIGEIRPVTAIPGTTASAICGLEPFDGFHYCNFGLSECSRPLSPRPASSSQAAHRTRAWRSSSSPATASISARCSSRR